MSQTIGRQEQRASFWLPAVVSMKAFSGWLCRCGGFETALKPQIKALSLGWIMVSVFNERNGSGCAKDRGSYILCCCSWMCCSFCNWWNEKTRSSQGLFFNRRVSWGMHREEKRRMGFDAIIRLEASSPIALGEVTFWEFWQVRNRPQHLSAEKLLPIMPAYTSTPHMWIWHPVTYTSQSCRFVLLHLCERRMTTSNHR